MRTHRREPFDENPRLAGRGLSSKGDAPAARPCAASHHLALRSVAARVAFPSVSDARPCADRSLLAEPQSLRLVRTHPCSAQEENPLSPKSLSMRSVSRSGFPLSTAFTRLRLGLDHIAELPERDFPKETEQRVERGIGARVREVGPHAAMPDRDLAAVARFA